jgi:hypothetical protein
MHGDEREQPGAATAPDEDFLVLECFLVAVDGRLHYVAGGHQAVYGWLELELPVDPEVPLTPVPCPEPVDPVPLEPVPVPVEPDDPVPVPEVAPVPVDPDPEVAPPDPLPLPVAPAELPEPVPAPVPEPVPEPPPELPVPVPVDVPVPPLPVAAPTVDVTLPASPPVTVVVAPTAVVSVFAGGVGSGGGNNPSAPLPTTIRWTRCPERAAAEALWAVETAVVSAGEVRESVTASTVVPAARLVEAAGVWAAALTCADLCE